MHASRARAWLRHVKPAETSFPSMRAMADEQGERLAARRARIDTYQQPVIYMHAECPVCRAEGFEAQAQVEVTAHGRTVLAILHRVDAARLSLDEAALSEAAWTMLDLCDGDEIRLRHAPQLESLAALRGRCTAASSRMRTSARSWTMRAPVCHRTCISPPSSRHALDGSRPASWWT